MRGGVLRRSAGRGGFSRRTVAGNNAVQATSEHGTLGETMFIASSIAKTPTEKISAKALSFVGRPVGVVIIMLAFLPDLVLWLPWLLVH